MCDSRHAGEASPSARQPEHGLSITARLLDPDFLMKRGLRK